MMKPSPNFFWKLKEGSTPEIAAKVLALFHSYLCRRISDRTGIQIICFLLFQQPVTVSIRAYPVKDGAETYCIRSPGRGPE